MTRPPLEPQVKSASPSQCKMCGTGEVAWPSVRMCARCWAKACLRRHQFLAYEPWDVEPVWPKK